MADREAKWVAETERIEVMSLIPDGKLVIEQNKPRYSKEDMKLIEDLEGQGNEKGWIKIPHRQVVIAYNQSWKLIQEVMWRHG